MGVEVLDTSGCSPPDGFLAPSFAHSPELSGPRATLFPSPSSLRHLPPGAGMLPRGLAGIHSPLRFCLCFLAMKKPHLTPIKAPRVGSQGHTGPHPSSHFTSVCLSAGGPAPVPGRRLGGATLLLCSALGSPTLLLTGPPRSLAEGRQEGRMQAAVQVLLEQEECHLPPPEHLPRPRALHIQLFL